MTVLHFGDILNWRRAAQKQDILQGISSTYSDTNSGDVAARMLMRIEKEMGEQK